MTVKGRQVEYRRVAGRQYKDVIRRWLLMLPRENLIAKVRKGRI